MVVKTRLNNKIKTSLSQTDGMSLDSHRLKIWTENDKCTKNKKKTKKHRTQDNFIDVESSGEEESGGVLARLLPAPWVSKES